MLVSPRGINKCIIENALFILNSFFGAFAAIAATPGWENVCATRCEAKLVKTVWTAPLAGFAFERENGAEGEVLFDGAVITIRKTNAVGRIIVKAPAFSAAGEVRLFADVSVSSRSPMSAKGYLATLDEKGLLEKDTICKRWFSGGGIAMKSQVNSAPGMTYRKYGHAAPREGLCRPVIVVEGGPSASTWRNWAAEDLEASQAVWTRMYENETYPDRSADRIQDEEFARRIAADIDHVAEIRRVDGTSRFFLDGVETPPIVYKATTVNKGGTRVTYAGKPLQRAGVRVGVVNLKLGAMPDAPAPWSKDGFDIAWAMRIVRDAMRVGDESCFILAIGTSAYPEFTADIPEETWKRADGTVVFGNSGSAIPDVYNDGGAKDKGDRRWPWISYSSKVWQDAVIRIFGELAAELKRTGLSKRIVGVHFYGYHDGQFSVPVEDHSKPARAEYARWLSERGLKAGEPGSEYAFFMKQAGFRAVERFSRAAKQLFGKPIVAVRWCMLPFGGVSSASYDIGSFLRSDAVDVIVPQPTYTQRQPGLGQGMRLPCSSLHAHGKMMWYEFDLRTYAAYDFWARSIVAVKGLNTAEDLPMWQTVFRKHAGIMFAQRMGWWFYDMADGWFSPPEIVADIAEVYRNRMDLDSCKPDPWRPDLALVIDEEALASYGRADGPAVGNRYSLVMGQWPRTALSGVPYDVWLAEDFYRDPGLASRYKALVLCAFNAPNERQRGFVNGLDVRGIRHFTVEPGGFDSARLNAFAREAGCFVAAEPDGVQIDMNGDFLSVHCVLPGRWDVRLPFHAKVVNLKSMEESEVLPGGVLPLELTAGETCWFRLYRKEPVAARL